MQLNLNVLNNTLKEHLGKQSLQIKTPLQFDLTTTCPISNLN